jgi:archaemetzincin
MTVWQGTRRDFLTMLGALALTRNARAEGATGAHTQARLVLLPLGDQLPASDVDFVRLCMQAFYNFQVDVLEGSELPKAAYYAPRKRYRAELLLDHLERVAPANAVRVLGLTAVDISTTRGSVPDWGILGLATVDGRVGVLSKYRCRRGAKTDIAALHRFGKTAVHELGHTLGLNHCPQLGCLMEDARGTVFTTDREYDLCAKCRARLQSLGRAALEHPTIPWPEPA